MPDIESEPRYPTLSELSLPLAATPEAVCVALVRYAAAPDARSRQLGTWTARREPGDDCVTLTLTEGPLSHLVLRCLARPDTPERTMLSVATTYARRSGRLPFPSELMHARQEAAVLRNSMVAAILETFSDQSDPAAKARRESRRLPIRASARVFAGNREWRGEVLDVSAGGLALVLVALPAHAQADAAFLIKHADGEVEVVLPGYRERLRIRIVRAEQKRGGVQVGVQMVAPESTMPLLRKALDRANTQPPRTSG